MTPEPVEVLVEEPLDPVAEQAIHCAELVERLLDVSSAFERAGMATPAALAQLPR